MIQFETTFQPELQGSRYMVEIPVNLWEAFDRKGNFKVQCAINGMVFTVSPIPKGKGFYLLSLTKDMQKKLELKGGERLWIMMEPAAAEAVPQAAPEPVSKSTRKPAELRLVMQNTPKTCGQACIAMLAGVSIEEAIAVMHTSGPTAIGMLAAALDHYGIGHSGKNIRLSKKNPDLPEMAILTVHMPEYNHWVIYHKGRYYDPEFGLLNACHPQGRITSFLEVYT